MTKMRALLSRIAGLLPNPAAERDIPDESLVLPSIASAIRDIDPAIVTTNAAGFSTSIHDAPAIGIFVGLVCAIGAATLGRNLFFGTAGRDVPTPAAVVAVPAVASLVASYIPARRAASVNPLEALLAE
jgi:hypothetical protein